MKINASTCALIVCAVSVITPTHSKQISAQASVIVVSSAPTLKALSEMAFPTIQKSRMSGKIISTHPIEYSQDRKIATVKTKDNLRVNILHGQANSNINIQTSSIIKNNKDGSLSNLTFSDSIIGSDKSGNLVSDRTGKFDVNIEGKLSFDVNDVDFDDRHTLYYGVSIHY